MHCILSFSKVQKRVRHARGVKITREPGKTREDDVAEVSSETMMKTRLRNGDPEYVFLF